MSYDVIQSSVTSNVADNGTFTVGYPTGRTAGSYSGGYAHKLYVNGTLYEAPTSFTVAFTTVITVTWLGDTTLVAGTPVALQLDKVGADRATDPFPSGVTSLPTYLVNLGSPIAAAANGLFLSASIATATPVVVAGFTGASHTAGVLGTPRNIVGTWTGTAVMTITGKDVYGNAMVESSASGTSLTGKKAFKSISKIAVSGNVTSATVGTGEVLGLPFFLPGTALAYVLKEIVDGAVATAGTTVAGVTATPTATTGDVRGTYTPNAASDGAKTWQLLIASADPFARGAVQYSV